jgi:hypothetical protein
MTATPFWTARVFLQTAFSQERRAVVAGQKSSRPVGGLVGSCKRRTPAKASNVANQQIAGGSWQGDVESASVPLISTSTYPKSLVSESTRTASQVCLGAAKERPYLGVKWVHLIRGKRWQTVCFPQ